MEINRNELEKALTHVKPGLAQKEMIEQATHFIFTKKGISTFNDEISVYHPIKTGLNGAVQSEEFHKLISKMGKKTVELEQTENEITIKGGRTKAGVRIQTEIKLPLDSVEERDEDNWQDIPEGLFEGLKLCISATAKDMASPILTNIAVLPGRLLATDRFRISQYIISKGVKTGFLINARTVPALLNLDATHYQLTGSWLHFQNEEGTVFSCRVYSENFPVEDIDNVLNKSRESVKIQFPEILDSLLERITIFTKQEFRHDEEVSISIEGKVMKLRGEGIHGWVEETTSMKKGKDLEFSINPHLLKEILSLSKDCMVSDDCVIFSSENFTHLISLSSK